MSNGEKHIDKPQHSYRIVAKVLRFNAGVQMMEHVFVLEPCFVDNQKNVIRDWDFPNVEFCTNAITWNNRPIGHLMTLAG